MADYIDRDALLEKRWDVPFETEDARFVQVVDVQDIMAAPASDVEKVRHGRLVNANNRKKTYQRRCTSRGEIAYYCGIGCSYKFCPNCGCCMDGGESNG